MAEKKGIFDTIGDAISGFEKKLQGSDIGKELAGKLDSIKSFDPQEITQILSALGQSADKKVQDAKTDLEGVKHDGETFATKLKGYIAELPQLLKTLLPTLQNLLSNKK